MESYRADWADAIGDIDLALLSYYTNSFTADGSSVVLVSRDHPALAGAVGGGPGGREWIREICGKAPEVPESLQWLLEPVVPQKRIDGSLEEVEAILNQLAEEG